MSSESNIINETRSRLREQMPVARKWAYFDHAAVAPISEPARLALESWLEQAAFEGDTVWLDWARQLKATRAAAAQLINAELDEIALVPNTTAGINLVAEGLDWRAGDNVVTLDDEFPSNLFPWTHLQRLGIETRQVPTSSGYVELDQLANYCDERTRVVSVSWVGYANGCRRDLAAIAEIAHRHEALFFVDAIQGLGVFPLDVAEIPIDCLAADGHKWMLGPEGAGIAFIRRDWLPRLTPIGVGWQSVVQAGDFSNLDLDFKSTAARYEGGSHNMAGFLALGASLQLLLDLGVSNIASAILDITEHLADALTDFGAIVSSPRSPAASSGIVSFELLGYDANAVRRHCLDHGVALACRAGRLRVSAHAYNNEDDVQRLLATLRSAPK